MYEFEFGYRNQLNSNLKLYNELQSRNIIIRNLDIPEKSDYYKLRPMSNIEYQKNRILSWGFLSKAEDYYGGIMLKANTSNSFNSG